MTNKFEIGSQWKTRGGWRAVVVKRDNQYLYVWHDQCDYDVVIHEMDGSTEDADSHDLISPWVEPKEHDFWINIYEDRRGGRMIYMSDTKEEAQALRNTNCIACINLKFPEGEGL